MVIDLSIGKPNKGSQASNMDEGSTTITEM